MNLGVFGKEKPKGDGGAASFSGVTQVQNGPTASGFSEGAKKKKWIDDCRLIKELL